MSILGAYDPELGMFIEQDGNLNLAYLDFLRWMGEHGRLEHEIAGPSSGELDDLIQAMLHEPV